MCRDSSGKTIAPPDPSLLSISVDEVASPQALTSAEVLRSELTRDGLALAVSYVVTRSGPHRLHITVAGSPVHGSPFPLVVAAGASCVRLVIMLCES